MADQPQNIKQKSFKKILWVVEGRDYYYVLAAGMGTDPSQKGSKFNAKSLKDILASFTLLKDPTVNNWVDAVIAENWQKYMPTEQLIEQQEARQVEDYKIKEAKPTMMLYQGQDEQLINSPFANYWVVYNFFTNQIYINTQKVPISQGDLIQAALHTGLSRKDNYETKLMTEEQKRHLAYDRGEHAATIWRRFSDPSKTRDREGENAWNVRSKEHLANNNMLIAEFKPKAVKAWPGPVLFEMEPSKVMSVHNLRTTK